MLRFRKINIEEIKQAVSQVMSSKGFGIDHICSYFVKEAIPYIENIPVFTFSTSIEASVFPDTWKIARLAPIFKGSDNIDKSNYRSSSVLALLLRVFKKLAFNQLYKELEEKCFLSTNHHGFRALHSTTTPLLKNSKDWHNAMDSGEITRLLLIRPQKSGRYRLL